MPRRSSTAEGASRVCCGFGVLVARCLPALVGVGVGCAALVEAEGGALLGAGAVGPGVLGAAV